MPGTDEAGTANVNGSRSLAACAAALSDDALEVLYRTVDGGDPGGKSQDELVAWLSAMPDEASTRERILARLPSSLSHPLAVRRVREQSIMPSSRQSAVGS
jgi:hypothetical protein